MSDQVQERDRWLFLTTHMHVLLYVVAHAEATAREIAAAVGVTERHARRVLADLVDGGYLEKQRQGAGTIYSVRRDVALKHPRLAGVRIGALIDAIEAARGES